MLKVKWIKLFRFRLDSMHCLWHESYDCNWSWKGFFVCQTLCSFIVLIHFIFTISHLHSKLKLHLNYFDQSLTFVRLLGEPLLFNQMQLTFFRVPCKIRHQWPLVLSGVMSLTWLLGTCQSPTPGQWPSPGPVPWPAACPSPGWPPLVTCKGCYASHCSPWLGSSRYYFCKI